MVLWEIFIFCHYLWISWHRGFDVFSMAIAKCTGLMKIWSNLGFFFVLLRARRCSQFLTYFTTASDLLQVTIAFVLKIFSLSDKKKVLDVFDRHCWDAACCSRMSEVRDYQCSWLAVTYDSLAPCDLPTDFMGIRIIPSFAIFYCQVFMFSSFS